MNHPEKRNSSVINNLRKKRDPLVHARITASMLLAARIAKGIKEKNYGKAEFADLMQKKPSVITKWLSGTHNFTSDTLSDIQYYLDIKLLNLEDMVPVVTLKNKKRTTGTPKTKSR